jgi:HlyD family secretion protein
VDGTVLSSILWTTCRSRPDRCWCASTARTAKRDLHYLQQQLSDAQQAWKKATDNLANCSAVAPIDGTVMGLSIQPRAEELTNTAAVVTIADTSVMLIDATVDERNISYVKAGTPVDIKDWSDSSYTAARWNRLPHQQGGKRRGQLSHDHLRGQQTAGTINGSNVNYSLVASQNDNCLVLPIQCVKYVQLDDGTTGTVVFVKADSKPDGAIDLPTWPDGVPEGYWPVPVEIGISDDNNIEIKSGAEEGTTVFTRCRSPAPREVKPC